MMEKPIDCANCPAYGNICEYPVKDYQCAIFWEKLNNYGKM